MYGCNLFNYVIIQEIRINLSPLLPEKFTAINLCG